MNLHFTDPPGFQVPIQGPPPPPPKPKPSDLAGSGDHLLKFTVETRNPATGAEDWNGILFPSRAEAEACARETIAANPHLECFIGEMEIYP